jgi:hypothetical protein
LNRDFEEYSFTSCKGKIPSAEEETDIRELSLINEVTAHTWSKNNSVYVANGVGELYLFDPAKGIAGDSIMIGDGDPTVTSILLTQFYLVCGCNDGYIRWIHVDDHSMDHKASVTR